MTPLAHLRKDELIYLATHRCPHRHLLIEHPQCVAKRVERVGFLDIETSNLVADFGIVLTWCIKPEGSKEILSDRITLTDIRKAHEGDEDKRVVSTCIEALQQFDLIITFYGKRFDIPFLRTRALATGQPFPSYGTLRHIDCYDLVKHRFRLSSNRLVNACRVLLGKTNKTPIESKYWRAGARGNTYSLKQILKHNRFDVLDLEDLYRSVVPFARMTRTSV
jgi:uncharacterized protein YprB with RNaseH-like and TPR domain